MNAPEFPNPSDNMGPTVDGGSDHSSIPTVKGNDDTPANDTSGTAHEEDESNAQDVGVAGVGDQAAVPAVEAKEESVATMEAPEPDQQGETKYSVKRHGLDRWFRPIEKGSPGCQGLDGKKRRLLEEDGDISIPDQKKRETEPKEEPPKPLKQSTLFDFGF
ncbi:hypothetical protein K469DRAFT_786423 [Zopfia rhizophila CBS 207.26]|uniref:Uncharacterized protein n=1 Tax=Zopfia rhizophila CBS 207.26 TaxID=1314779 RepID=A0A6A6DZK7_9PEZI|nr:hypothetical protein K469DRAFT_786423 [Zopfia rhizophila CBS 207.26]